MSVLVIRIMRKFCRLKKTVRREFFPEIRFVKTTILRGKYRKMYFFYFKNYKTRFYISRTRVEIIFKKL